ncbi:unnamed protein product [Closterium sp. Yama58-4]|nr:unnamed protein product [Closterium sp. Yama58-4]
MFGFMSKPKTPAEIVRALADGLQTLPRDDKSAEEVLKSLVTVRVLLIGDLDAPPNKEAVAAAVAESVKCDLLPLLVSRLPVFDWEARKEMVLVWTYLLAHGGKRRRPKADEEEEEDEEEGGEGGGAQKGAPQEEEEEEGPAVALEFVERHTELVDKLVRGYKQKDIAQNSGLMLRECLRSPKLVSHTLQFSNLDIIMGGCDLQNFDIASDAFLTLKDLLKQHPAVAAEFLMTNFEDFFKRFDLLLNSDNYVTRRQAIKLLGELLLDRANMQVMMRYIGEAHNFKIMMTLIKDPSRAIQYEAFHVFKIFVANPRKPEKIVKLLARNKEKMVKFLKDFEIDKEEEDFEEEKEMLIREIQNAHYPGLG